VTVDLEAFSPFIPLNADDSSLPATVFRFTLHNPGPGEVEVELRGWLENAVGNHHREAPGERANQARSSDRATILALTARGAGTDSLRPDILFEDWSHDAYEGWSVAGEAFGGGPVRKKDIPGYQGNVGGDTERVVNSHASAPGDGVGSKDAKTGRPAARSLSSAVSSMCGSAAARIRTGPA
jgi:hypothetical protein